VDAHHAAPAGAEHAVRLVHLADLHLGFRQYQRLTPGGINQREADVARAFQRAIEKVIELRPDVVVIAGDIFHSVRPTNPAIVHAFRQFSLLRNSLPDAAMVMVAGNHDTPRTTETGGILRLFRELGIEVADADVRRIPFPDRDLEILAGPDMAGDRPAYSPNLDVRYNVAVLHGEVEGLLPPLDKCPERKAMEIPLRELLHERWNYVALGHYHVYREIGERVFYSGSTEYASTNIWRELAEETAQGIRGKGIIEHDLETGAHKFHSLEPVRQLVDLPPIRARGMTAPELDFAIRETLDACPGGIEGKILRLIVYDVPRHVARSLDHRALREYRRRALHFHLDTRRPEIIRTQISGAPGRRASLAELVRDSLRSRHLERGTDREELVALGLRYLRDAETAETPVLLEQEAE
jgi:exonuclease SbcD